jgi:hypothetical protein
VSAESGNGAAPAMFFVIAFQREIAIFSGGAASVFFATVVERLKSE